MSVDSYARQIAERRQGSRGVNLEGSKGRVKFERMPGKEPNYRLSNRRESFTFNPHKESLPGNKGLRAPDAT